MGMEPTTVVVGEPALSFTYDSKRSLYEQFSKPQNDSDDGEDDGPSPHAAEQGTAGESDGESASASAPSDPESSDASKKATTTTTTTKKNKKFGPASPFFSMFSLFEGSPTYKQRRKKLHRTRRTPPDAFGGGGGGGGMDGYMAVVTGRMREPHVDRFGRDASRMSASELFVAQARGDFDGQSNPDLVASQKERQRRALEAQFALTHRQRFMDPARAGSVPQPALAHDMHASSMMMDGGGGQPGMLAPFPGQLPPQRPAPHTRHTFPNADLPHHARSLSQPFPGAGGGVPFADADAWAGAADVRAKAFVCPLFSCGRMFKRMEHLKRHLRTHTLERPYQCARCQKRFSRSDNLAQHQRTHLRAEDGGEPLAEGEQDPDESDADVSVGDPQLYEVELQGPVHEVQGDEEGLVMAAGAVPVVAPSDEMQDGFYQAQALNEQGSYNMQADGSPGSQWATLRPHSSMSYNGGGQQPMRMSPPTFGINGDYGLSLSAPSQRATFDHGALYPPELDVGGPGPIRRHRSVTPARFGENIRRPYSVASDHGVPVGRPYHPYAHAYSAESSPMASTVPLGYGGAAPPMAGLSRAHSRAGSGSSNELQDQMRQMMSLQQQQPEMDVEHAQAPFMRDPLLTSYSAPFRTDSPMQYATTAGNEYELVNMLGTEDAGQQVPMYAGLYGLPEQQGEQYVAQGPVSDGSYAAFAHGDPQQVLM
ncbi:hypothetical protein DAEQUDRAFT_324829 [Daedalea quercina L-15889]|uniref:C2H2-type domain-containing protein n=1 Tax=Daedalea quercina L-15889 TaxID=1314783 RepID=A0A165PUF4_9APHY|nr:hypothetical protein DAEQUDRAFT_324829 [Daedalea quercina L-15889]